MKTTLAVLLLLLGQNLYCHEAPLADSAEHNELVFKGCSIIRRAFMTEAARAFDEKTGIHIDVMGGGATLGIRASAAGDADIGGSCRPALPDLSEEERGVEMTHVAWDALVFVTHPSNPVGDISLEQAKSILLGKIDNWQDLGGPDHRIISIFRSQVPEHGGKLSGVGYMTRLMLFDDPSKDFTSHAIFFRHSAEIEEALERIPFSFGVTGISSAKKRSVKILTLDGVEPTQANIASGLYPLFRPLYLMTKGPPKGQVKEFIDWLLSDEGQKIVADQGTVTLKEGAGLQNLFRHQPGHMKTGIE